MASYGVFVVVVIVAILQLLILGVKMKLEDVVMTNQKGVGQVAMSSCSRSTENQIR